MRDCEYADCNYFGDRDRMVRLPSGEWYCLAHVALLAVEEGT